jgi:hypothetical protein
MISGECRVEPVGLATGRQLALEGLRLRLDLRIVPGSAENGSAAAVWRIEDRRVRTLRLRVPAVYRRAAMITGLGVLCISLVIWFAGSRSTSNEHVGPAASGSQVITTTVAPAARDAAPPATAHAPAVAVASEGVSSGVAPPVSPANVQGLAPSLTPARAELAAEPATNAAPNAAATAGRTAAVPRPRPAPERDPGGDGLELFSDPK